MRVRVGEHHGWSLTLQGGPGPTDPSWLCLCKDDNTAMLDLFSFPTPWPSPFILGESNVSLLLSSHLPSLLSSLFSSPVTSFSCSGAFKMSSSRKTLPSACHMCVIWTGFPLHQHSCSASCVGAQRESWWFRIFIGIDPIHYCSRAGSALKLFSQ